MDNRIKNIIIILSVLLLICSTGSISRADEALIRVQETNNRLSQENSVFSYGNNQMIEGRNIIEAIVKNQTYASVASTKDSTLYFTEDFNADGMTVRFDYYGSEEGISRVESTIAELDIRVTLTTDGITVEKNTSSSFGQGEETCSADAEKQISQISDRLSGISGLSGNEDVSEPGKDPALSRPSLDQEVVDDFIEKMTEKDTIRELERIFKNLEDRNSRSVEFVEKIKKNYTEFQEEIQTEISLDISNTDSQSISQTVADIEKYVNIIKNDEELEVSQQKEELLEKYYLLQEETRVLIGQYMSDLRGAKSIFEKLNKMFDTEEPQVYLDEDEDGLKVLIYLKKKKKISPIPEKVKVVPTPIV